MTRTKLSFRPRLRHLAYFAIAIVGLAAAMEGASWLMLRGTVNDTPEVWMETASVTRLERTDSEILHPYYGHTPNSHRSDLNILPPPQRQPGTVIIAMLGGSVAQAVAPMLRNAVFQHYLSEGSGTVPIFLDLTNDGYHQPQQAMIITNLLVNGGEFDVIVNLDGHEEIVAPVFNDSVGVYPFFPRRWSNMVVTSDRQLLLGRRQMLLDERDEILNVGWVESLYGSPTLRLLRRSRLDEIAEQIHEHEREWIAGSTGHDLAKHGPRVHYEPEELQEASVGIWRRSSWLLWAMADMGGTRYTHFLQPRYTGWETPSGDEVVAPVDQAGLTAESYSESYAMLVEAGQALAAEGINFVDLSELWAAGEEPLYEDTCCRLTEHGVRSLVQPLLQQVVEDADGLGEKGAKGSTNGLVPIGRDRFDVYRAGNYVVYVKEPCLPSDTEEPFFLTVTPISSDLVTSNQQPEADDLFWSFDQYGTRFAAQCVATVPLGYWLNASARTGQLAAADAPAWEIEFAVSRT